MIFQAGGSEAGKQLAAETGEVIFAAEPVLSRAKVFYDDTKSRLAAFGRSPDDCKICAGLSVLVAPTQAEAEDRFARMEAMVHPDVMRELLSNDLETDLSDVPIDAQVPMDRLPKEANQHKSFFEKMVAMLSEGPMTVRQLYHRFGSERGGRRLVGSPTMVADAMEDWFKAGAVDGYMLIFPHPTGMDDFATLVVPELQRRGLFRTDYEGVTLRDHLGLRRPPSRYASRVGSASRAEVIAAAAA